MWVDCHCRTPAPMDTAPSATIINMNALDFTEMLAIARILAVEVARHLPNRETAVEIERKILIP
jgi:hypothetical protein